MKAEIEKLRDELRDLATIYGQEHAWGSQLVAMNCADRLQSILDADYVANPSQLGCSCLCHEQDPVSKLEVMGWRLFVDRYGRICWNRYGDDGDGVGIMSGLCLVAADVAESAKAILARIEKEGE